MRYQDRLDATIPAADAIQRILDIAGISVPQGVLVDAGRVALEAIDGAREGRDDVSSRRE
jgi:hypothetical protein